MTSYDHRRLDELIHSRIRLSVMAILAGAEEAEFTYLRDQVNTTDGNLATHLRRLEDAGYIRMRKAVVDRRAVSRYSLTAAGRSAFRDYVDRLESLLPEGGDAGPPGR